MLANAAARVLAIYVALPLAASECPGGSIPGKHGVAACCPAACGHCGGRGCEERAGGREACCALDIQKARRSCNGTAPPCVPHGRVGIGEVPTNHSCTPLQRPRTALIPSASMRDAATKILIVSSPKAGATLAERIMLARLNLTGVAAAYRGKRNSSAYPLLYAHEVFQKQRSAGRYPDANHLADCADPSWLCIALVRTPLDRAVSSYVHSLKYFANVGAWAGVSPNTSFADFALDLDRRAHDRGHSRSDDHFMPQSSPAPHVLSVPIEMLSEPDGYACPLLERLQGWRVAELEGEALEHASTHYITQAKASAHCRSHW